MYFEIFAAQIEKESNDIDELGESRFAAFAKYQTIAKMKSA
jgi:hypothetical protein